MKKIYIIALLVINVVFCVSSMEIKEPLDVQLLDAVCKPNNIEEIRGLLEQGADINRQNSWGWSSLHHAADYCYVEYIKFLLARGADVNIKAKSGKTPAACALFSYNTVNKLEAVKLFFECGIDLKVVRANSFRDAKGCLVLLLTETAILQDSIATMLVNATYDINLLKPDELELVNYFKSSEDTMNFDDSIEYIKKNRKKIAPIIPLNNDRLKQVLYTTIPNVSFFEQARLQIMKNIIAMLQKTKDHAFVRDVISAQSFQELPAEIKEKTENSIIREFLVSDEEFSS